MWISTEIRSLLGAFAEFRRQITFVISSNDGGLWLTLQEGALARTISTGLSNGRLSNRMKRSTDLDSLALTSRVSTIEESQGAAKQVACLRH